MPQISNVVCFGEILWDILPTASKPGGATLNVAYHLNRLGINTTLISRIGNDARGSELLNLVNSWKLSTEFCQVDDEYPTGEVQARINEHHKAYYDVNTPVAWDFINFNNDVEVLIDHADAFVFTSLAARNEVSRATLLRMLEISDYNVFDVNLRVPHFSPQVIEQLLMKTNLLQVNALELETIAKWFSTTCKSCFEYTKLLQDKFNIKEIIVTRGSQGASYFTPSIQYDFSAYRVEVADTIGSGDAFLAGFLAKRIQLENIDTAVAYAGALGALVTMHSGACPQYSLDDLEDFKGVRELKRVYR